MWCTPRCLISVYLRGTLSLLPHSEEAKKREGGVYIRGLKERKGEDRGLAGGWHTAVYVRAAVVVGAGGGSGARRARASSLRMQSTAVVQRGRTAARLHLLARANRGACRRTLSVCLSSSPPSPSQSPSVSSNFFRQDPLSYSYPPTVYFIKKENSKTRGNESW